MEHCDRSSPLEHCDQTSTKCHLLEHCDPSSPLEHCDQTSTKCHLLEHCDQNMLRTIAYQLSDATKSVSLFRECCTALSKVDFMPLRLTDVDSRQHLEAQNKNLSDAIKSGTFAVVGLLLHLPAYRDPSYISLAAWFKSSALQSLHSLTLHQISREPGDLSGGSYSVDLSVLEHLQLHELRIAGNSHHGYSVDLSTLCSSSLRVLYLEGGSSTPWQPLANLPALEKLYISQWCPRAAGTLASFSPGADFCVLVSQLASLKELHLGRTVWHHLLFASNMQWSLLLNLRALTQLRIHFKYNVDPAFLRVASELPTWTRVELLCGSYDCHHADIVDLSQLILVQQLRVLQLRTDVRIGKTELLGQMTQLTDLSLNVPMASVEDLTTLSRLVTLSLASVESGVNVGVLGEGCLPGLTSLSLALEYHVGSLDNGIAEFVGLEKLCNLSSLKELSLSRCQIESLQLLRELIPQLYELTLTACTKLTNVDSVGFGTRLVALNLDDCISVVDASAVSSCQKLERLTLTGCRGLTDYSFLGELSELRHVSLSICRLGLKLVHASGWRSLDRCTKLDWENCKGLPDKTPNMIVSASSLFGDDDDY